MKSAIVQQIHQKLKCYILLLKNNDSLSERLSCSYHWKFLGVINFMMLRKIHLLELLVWGSGISMILPKSNFYL